MQSVTHRLPKAALTLLIWLTFTGAVQATHCDPDLPVRSDHPQAYRDRGSRCEGIFVKDVAGTSSLVVLAVSERPLPHGTATSKILGPDDKLRIEWAHSERQSATLAIRAVSLKRRIYYRMDRRQNAAISYYDWPTDVLHSVSLNLENLGIAAWLIPGELSTSRRIFLPAYVTGTSRPTDGRIHLLVRSSENLKELFLAHGEVDSEGREQPPRHDAPLNRGYYPAGAPIEIQIKRYVSAHKIWVSINAVTSHGRRINSSFWVLTSTL